MGKGKVNALGAMPSPQGDLALLGDWLSGLPANTRVGWDEMSMDELSQFSSSWLDIHFQVGDNPAPVMLTVVPAGQADSLDDVELAYDCQLEVVFEGERVARLELRCEDSVVEVADPDLPGEIEESWNFFWRRRLQQLEGEDNRWAQPAWSREAIVGLLDRLALMYGRQDLKFVFERPELNEDELELNAEQDQTYQIGEGLYATGEAFGQLLDMPAEDAAAITEALQTGMEPDQLFPPGQ